VGKQSFAERQGRQCEKQKLSVGFRGDFFEYFLYGRQKVLEVQSKAPSNKKPKNKNSLFTMCERCSLNRFILKQSIITTALTTLLKSRNTP